MDKQNSNEAPVTPVETPTIGVNDARRRFTKTGLGAGAVIATLASQPVLGAVPYNCTISGHASGNVSTHGPAADCSIGLSHGYWKNHTSNWPSPFASTQLFKDAGTSNSLLDAPGVTTGKTMLQVLKLGGGGMTALAREVVGALLNSQNFAPNFPVSVAQIKAIWNEVVNTGAYQVNTNVTWTAEDVKNYLESLHD
jgi:hypothetical protein